VTPADLEKQRLAIRDLLNRAAEEVQWEDIDQGSNAAPHHGTYQHETYGEVTEGVGEWSNLPAFDSLSPFQELWKQIETLQTAQPREGIQVTSGNRAFRPDLLAYLVVLE
jgi:hypothetical protein